MQQTRPASRAHCCHGHTSVTDTCELNSIDDVESVLFLFYFVSFFQYTGGFETNAAAFVYTRMSRR